MCVSSLLCVWKRQVLDENRESGLAGEKAQRGRGAVCPAQGAEPVPGVSQTRGAPGASGHSWTSRGERVVEAAPSWMLETRATALSGAGLTHP